jgi:hypothetical protein
MHAWEAQLSLVHVHVPMFRPVWWLQADNRSSQPLNMTAGPVSHQTSSGGSCVVRKSGVSHTTNASSFGGVFTPEADAYGV